MSGTSSQTLSSAVTVMFIPYLQQEGIVAQSFHAFLSSLNFSFLCSSFLSFLSYFSFLSHLHPSFHPSFLLSFLLSFLSFFYPYFYLTNRVCLRSVLKYVFISPRGSLPSQQAPISHIPSALPPSLLPHPLSPISDIARGHLLGRPFQTSLCEAT